MNVLVAMIVLVASTALAACMAAAEASVALLPGGRVSRLVENGRSGAHALEHLATHLYRLRGASAIIAGLAYAASAGSAAWAFAGDGVGWTTISALAAAGALLIVFSIGQTLPRTVAVQNPESVALAFAGVALGITRVAYPVARVLAAPWRWLMRLVVGEQIVASPWWSTDELRSGSPGDEESERDQIEEALFEAVSEFTEKVVREVMVPRTDMTCLPDDATAEEAIEVIQAAGFSRLPVYHETLDDIRGVLFAKDLLAAVAGCAPVKLSTILREAFFVPETKPVQELLREMRKRTHIAIVADEYGGTAGMVTIEDLLEEIVGEIFDEYDAPVELVVDAGQGRYRVDARLPVDDLNELFGTAIESEADSIGGLVSEIAGRIPSVGDMVNIEGLEVVVEKLEGNRIMQLAIAPAAPSIKEAPDA